MSRIDTHVAAVQRKLTLGIFVNWLAMTAFVAAVLALLTILSQKVLPFRVPLLLLWIALGAILAVSLLMAMIHRPSPAAAAVAIDDKLQLKEKFSTALHARGLADPFAQAVVRDAEQTAGRVHLAGQFPVSVPRTGYWAIGVAIMAGVSLMLPHWNLFHEDPAVLAKKQDQIKLEEKSKQIVQEAAATIAAMPRAVQEMPEVKLAKNMLENESRHPTPDPARASRRALEALSAAKEAMKKKAEESQTLAQAQKVESMMASMNQPVEGTGPVAEAQKKIVKGDYEEAMKDLKDLADKWNEKTPEEQKEAAQDMKKLAAALQRMADDPRAMQKLQDQLKQAGATQQQQQQIQQAMQKAAAGDKGAQQQAQQLAQQIAQQMQQGGASQQQMQQMQQAMNQAMQSASAQQSASQMAQAAQQMAQAMQQGSQGQNGTQSQQQMAQGQQSLADTLNQLKALAEDAENMQKLQQGIDDQMAQAGQGLGQGEGDNPGQGQQGKWAQGDPNKPFGPGQGGPGVGAGGNMGKAIAPFQAKSELSRSKVDEKNGKFLASVYVKDRSIKGEQKAKLAAALDAGQADEGDDVDDSRADKRSQNVEREYFNRMRDEVTKTGG